MASTFSLKRSHRALLAALSRVKIVASDPRFAVRMLRRPSTSDTVTGLSNGALDPNLPSVNGSYWVAKSKLSNARENARTGDRQ